MLKGHVNRAGARGRSLTQIVESPSDVQHLSLSHRLIVDAIHRRLSVDHTTVEPVLQGTDHTLRLMPACKDQLVIPRSTTSKNRHKKMTDNMQKVAKRVGLPQEVTYCSFRRQFGTHIERALDVTTAQKAMDHETGSSTYHQHYDRGLDDVDATDLIVSDGDGRSKGDNELPLYLRRPESMLEFNQDVDKRARAILELEELTKPANTSRGNKKPTTRKARDARHSREQMVVKAMTR
jgi:hypothetical protein